MIFSISVQGRTPSQAAARFLFGKLCRQRGQPGLVLFLLIFDVRGQTVVGYHAADEDARRRFFSKHEAKSI
ncbi:hypothetical protein [Mesorhizobium sp. M0296]|uniref:hypothetical protein n=1 Tax=Mesorhizobium sp. M0296 TaxID=2956931 RepID=UPI00333A8270